jgi:hypothetical protein
MCGRYRRTTAEEEIVRQYDIPIPHGRGTSSPRFRPSREETAQIDATRSAVLVVVFRVMTLQGSRGKAFYCRRAPPSLRLRPVRLFLACRFPLTCFRGETIGAGFVRSPHPIG